MTVLNSITLCGATQVAPSTAGVEVPDSRRRLWVEDVQWVRASYAGGGLGDVTVGIGVSLDGGATWAPMVAPGPTLGLGSTVLASEWTDVTAWVPFADVLVNAMAYGSSLLGGLSYGIRFVELQVR